MIYENETNIYQTDAIQNGIGAGISAFDASLDQMSVFNRLTNNLANQGIYIEGGNLYINASMIHSGYLSADRIQGGVLTLGGENIGDGEIASYDSNGNPILKIDKTGLYNRVEDEFLNITESVIWGGYGTTTDGTLDLSAQENGQRDVVLDALTYDLVLRSRNGVAWLISDGDTKINCTNLEIAITSTNTLGYPVLSFNDAQAHNIRYAYISTTGADKYLFVVDGTGNTYRTTALTAVT